MTGKRRSPDASRLDRVVAEARRQRVQREREYREQALKMYPWVCGRCGREFTRANLHELTVHHRNHDHDDNPPDGSNWELLCVYCHDNEHQRREEALRASDLRHEALQHSGNSGAEFKPFAALKEMLDDGE